MRKTYLFPGLLRRSIISLIVISNIAFSVVFVLAIVSQAILDKKQSIETFKPNTALPQINDPVTLAKIP